MAMTPRRGMLAGMLGAAVYAQAPRAFSQSAAPKKGGTLRMAVDTVLASASLHEELTVATVHAFMPVFNNLVMFDQQKKENSVENIVPELATEWQWSDNGKKLSFKLNKGVTWHDGKPFTSADVKATWDTVCGRRDAKWRRAPRSGQFANLREVSTQGDDEVSFHLAEPQPSLLTLLATGFSPIYPAHLDGPVMRRQPVGTGPFKVAAYNSNTIKLVRNDNYWRPGKPYLDAIEWTVMPSVSTRQLAFGAERIDVIDMTPPVYQEVRRQAPKASYTVNMSNSHFHLFLNRQRPPFNDERIRRAVNLTLDREAFVKVVGGGFGRAGGAMLPAPEGEWGLTAEMLSAIPGYFGDIDVRREEARKLMSDAGFGSDKSLNIQFVTRNVGDFQPPAILAMDHLKQIGIQCELKLIETAQWNIVESRADWTALMSSYGAAADDPDVTLLDSFQCDAWSNFANYCDPNIQKLLHEQSATLDPAARKKLVQELDRLLQLDVSRPVLLHNAYVLGQHPYVRGLVGAENGIYNNWRLEDVWLDK